MSEKIQITKVRFLPEALTILPETLREAYDRNGYLYIVNGRVCEEPTTNAMFTTMPIWSILPYPG